MKLFLFALTLALSSANVACIGCTNVDPGHVGIEVSKCSGGGVNNQPLGTGYHFTGPCTDIIEYPTYQQNLLLVKTGEEGKPNEEINVTSSEGLPISVDVSMSFTTDGTKVPAIYTKFRQDINHISHGYIKQSMREAIQEVFAKHTAQQLYSDKKEIARAEIQILITKQLAKDGFQVNQFTINETRVPPDVTNAIKGKVAMVQMAQKAEQQVKMIEAQAKQTIVQAEAEASAKKLHADAEAYSNKKVAESISGTLVEYLRVQKWDGKMPQVTSGGGTLFNLK